MSKPPLVVVCGLPASGKSTLANRLGTELHLPVIVRDDIKTGLVETRGPSAWNDPVEHAQLAIDSFALFHRMGQAALDSGCGIVLEAAYHWPIAREELQPLRDVGTLVIVECRAAHLLLRDRFADRYERGERHPCHRDLEYLARMDRDEFDWTFYDVPSDIDAPVITVDTTAGYDPPRDSIVAQVRAATGTATRRRG